MSAGLARIVIEIRRRDAAAARAVAIMSVLAAVALGGMSCKTHKAPKVDWKSGTEGGTLVFEDSFERAALGDDWQVDGAWRIEDGWLHDSGSQNAGVWLNRELPERVRVEFKVRSELPKKGGFRGDIKCEVFGAEKAHQSGYILIFGGWENALNVIARLDEHGKDRLEDATRKVVAGQIYTMTIVRSDGTLRWYIDGEPFMRYEDPKPLRGHRFGFNNWASNVYFDDLKVWKL